MGYHLTCTTNGAQGVTIARILLIDDDVELLDMLKTYLEREEFAVTTANVAATGMAAALAWYVSKPIRSLRQALRAAAQGELDVRIGDSVGHRRDELADLGRDFDRTAARLKLLVDGQRRLLHDVSHELRSPLARLQAAVGLVRQHPGNVDAAIDRIEHESIRIDRLVDELLTLSRLEAGMASRPQESVNVAELVTEVVADATFELNARSALVAFDVRVESLELANVTGNSEMLHRALENVVRNSVRHTPSDGLIHIIGEYDVLRGEGRLTIADEGPGVRVAELASIFEPFFRGEATQGTLGHGLGLAITHRVIKSHGGHISASNRSSGGLAVEICLPA
jgi:two-component system OmpR family sensor kinase